MRSASTEAFEALLARLARLRRRALLVEVAIGLLLAVGTLLLAALAWVGLEALFFLAPVVRTTLGVLAWLTALTALFFAWRTTLPSLLNRHRFALRVEERYAHLAQRVISALELWSAPRAQNLYSPELLSATVMRAADDIAQVDPSRKIGRAHV